MVRMLLSDLSSSSRGFTVIDCYVRLPTVIGVNSLLYDFQYFCWISIISCCFYSFLWAICHCPLLVIVDCVFVDIHDCRCYSRFYEIL